MMSAIESTKSVATGVKKQVAPAAPRVSTHQDEIVATSLARDALKRDRYEFLVKAHAVLGVALCIVCAGLVFVSLQPVQTRFIATDPEGGVREIIPTDRPLPSSVEVLNWVNSAVAKSLTLSFAHQESQMAENRHLFTDSGWRGFEEALARNGVLTRIVSQMLVTTAVPREAPVVVWQGINRGGRYGWRVQLPINVRYRSSSVDTSQSYNVELVVTRRPESEHPSGLGIDQFVAR